MDVSYQYLSFFLEDDDKLAHIKAVRNDYGSGTNRSPPPPHCKILQAVMHKKWVCQRVWPPKFFSVPQLLDLPLYPSRWFKLAR